MRKVVSAMAVALFALIPFQTGRAQTPGENRYREVSPEDLVRTPRDFDESFVRVSGVCQLEFEGNTLWASPQARIESEYHRAIWLDVGWPVPSALNMMNGKTVVVEARFDADRRGHMDCCGGTLTDIRAIWLPGGEGAAYAFNFETRIDALEQLQFKTGWIDVGMRYRKALIQTSFELVNGLGASGAQRLPKPGDRIRLTERSRIHILDYATSGEQHRLQSPMANGRSRAQGDETRLWLPSGAVVQVADVQVAYARSIEMVWVRLVPVTRE